MYFKCQTFSLCLFLGTLCYAQSSENPNIVFIFCDDLNASGLGITADPNVVTPNIDSLAAAGLTFYNAHSNSTICGPSRASVFTGLLPSSSGHFGLNMGFESWEENPVLSQTTTMFGHMREEGYKVYASGKIFHAGRNRPTDFDDHYQKPFQGPWAFERRAHSDLPEEFSDLRISMAPLESLPTYADGDDGWFVFGQGLPFFYESEDNRDLLGDELSALYCDSIFELHNNLEEQEPFFLTVGVHNPHSPFHVPQKYFDLYPLEDLDLTPYSIDSIEFAAAAFGNRMNSNSNMHIDGLMEASPEEDPLLFLKKYMQGYLASVSFVDDVVGDILKSLEENNLADNTYVIISSDHGYHLGSKRVIKKSTLWDGASRVPLIISGPNLVHDSIRTPASLVDIYPTILDMANKPAPSSHVLDGVSLIDNSFNSSSNTAIIANSNITPTEIGAQGIVHHQHYAVVDGDYKYIYYSSGEDELYNLSEDPGELVDLSLGAENNQVRRRMYNLLGAKIDSLRLPVKSYECLFYGDFEQKFNGWVPAVESANRFIADPSENFDSRHLYLGSAGAEFTRNLNLLLTKEGLYGLSLKALASDVSGGLRIRLSGETQSGGVELVDTVLTLTSSAEEFIIPFIHEGSPSSDKMTFRMNLVDGEGAFIDDVEIVFSDLREEALTNCLTADTIPTDLSINEIPKDTLSGLLDQWDFSTGLSGLALQKWYKVIPESSSGIIITYADQGSNPLVEAYSGCEEDKFTSFNDLRNDSLEVFVSNNLVPGADFLVRIGNNTESLEEELPFTAVFQNLELITPEIIDNFLVINYPEYPNFQIKKMKFRVTPASDPANPLTFTVPVKPDGIYNLNAANLPDGLYTIEVGYTLTINNLFVPYGEGVIVEVGVAGLVEYAGDEQVEYLIYPNPVTPGQSAVTLIHQSSELSTVPVNVTLTSMGGTRIQQWRWENSDSPLDIDLPLLPKGIYFMQMIRSDGKVSVLKLKL